MAFGLCNPQAASVEWRHESDLHQVGTLLRAYESYCPPPQNAQQAQRQEEGQRALEVFHWKEGDRLPRAVALEQEFAVYVGGAKLTSRLDCALETEAGLELMDFKFTREVRLPIAVRTEQELAAACVHRGREVGLVIRSLAIERGEVDELWRTGVAKALRVVAPHQT